MIMMKQVKFRIYFLWLLAIDVLFTGIDGVIYYTVEALEVYSYPIPSFLLNISSDPLFWYAVGKFVATLIFGSILFYFVKKGKTNFARALILTLPIIILMEIRYIISGDYTTQWHIYNTIMHFVVLLLSSWIVFWKTKLFD